MKIGFDGKRALSNLTGLGNYSRLVIESLAKSIPETELVVYAPRDNASDRFDKIRGLRNVSLRLPRPDEKRLGGSLWRTWGITSALKHDGISLYHGLSNELPLNISKSGIPSVVTIHDVIYRRLPYCYKPADRIIYDYKYGHSCRNATRIIAVSERTKLDIMEYYSIPGEKIDVVYQGCDDIFRVHHTADEINAILLKYGITSPYIIQVGSIEKRKNAILTVRALSALPTDLNLVLVGRRTGYLKLILTEAEKLGVAGRIKVCDNVLFQDLPTLYQGAEVAVYPSYYEGFGIPVLEALCSRVACVAATGSCLEEAGGEGALYINPDNANQLAEALKSLITDKNLRSELIVKGLHHASLFHNSDIPGRIMEVYRKILPDIAD